MNNFVTIKKFTYLQELYVLRTLLEVNDIEYQVLDELTAQTIPYISNSVGGIRLQVRENDAERALKLLQEKGFIEPKKEETPSKIYSYLDRFTLKIPYLKNFKWEIRIIILVAFVTLFAALAIACFIPQFPY